MFADDYSIEVVPILQLLVGVVIAVMIALIAQYVTGFVKNGVFYGLFSLATYFSEFSYPAVKYTALVASVIFGLAYVFSFYSDIEIVSSVADPYLADSWNKLKFIFFFVVIGPVLCLLAVLLGLLLFAALGLVAWAILTIVWGIWEIVLYKKSSNAFAWYATEVRKKMQEEARAKQLEQQA